MRVELAAKEGPLGTGNYCIALELIALADQRAFMHIQYSYTQGALARYASQRLLLDQGPRQGGLHAGPG